MALNSKAGATVGTHTRIQTADERIPKGTGYITEYAYDGFYRELRNK